ncbi:hypothetical protein VCEC0012_000239A, partial [Vibrio cholerae O1 str. EC-0012]
MIALLGA